MGGGGTITYQYKVTEQNWIILTNPNDENDCQTIKFKGNSNSSKDVAMVIPAKLIDPEASADVGYEVSFKESNETEIPSTKPDQGKDPDITDPDTKPNPDEGKEPESTDPNTNPDPSKPDEDKDPVNPGPSDSNNDDNQNNPDKDPAVPDEGGEITKPKSEYKEIAISDFTSEIKEKMNNKIVKYFLGIETGESKYIDATVTINENRINLDYENNKISFKYNVTKAEEKIETLNNKKVHIATASITNVTPSENIKGGNYYFIYEEIENQCSITMLTEELMPVIIPNTSKINVYWHGYELSTEIFNYFLTIIPFNTISCFQQSKGKVAYENKGCMSLINGKIYLNSEIIAKYNVTGSCSANMAIIANLEITQSTNCDIIPDGTYSVIENHQQQWMLGIMEPTKNIGLIKICDETYINNGSSIASESINLTKFKNYDVADQSAKSIGTLVEASFTNIKIELNDRTEKNIPIKICDAIKDENGFIIAAIKVENNEPSPLLEDDYYLLEILEDRFIIMFYSGTYAMCFQEKIIKCNS